MALPDFLLKKGGAFFIPALKNHLSNKPSINLIPSIPINFWQKKSHIIKIPLLSTLLLTNQFLIKNTWPNTSDKTGISAPQKEERILRVVSCAPSITEMICELGAEKNLVGITNLCSYPAEKLKGIPRIGTVGSFSAEKILSLHPDVVFAINTQSEKSLLIIRKAGIKVIQIDPQSIQEIKNSILMLGEILGKKQKAHDIIREMDSIIDKIKNNAHHTKSLKIYIEIFYPPPWTASSSTFIGEIVEIMGFKNIFGGGYKINTTRKNYFPITSEEIISRRPDAVLILSGDTGFKQRRGFENLPAVRDNFIILPHTTQREALIRATPRMLKEYLKLQETQILPLIKSSELKKDDY